MTYSEKRKAYQREYRRRERATPEGTAKNRAASAKNYAELRSTEEGRKKLKANHLPISRKHLYKTYGLTVEQVEAMKVDQTWGCAICGMDGKADRYGILCVDHDHATGKVRGLLCNSCNLGLSNFGDSPGRLEIAAAYLRRA